MEDFNHWSWAGMHALFSLDKSPKELLDDDISEQLMTFTGLRGFKAGVYTKLSRLGYPLTRPAKMKEQKTWDAAAGKYEKVQVYNYDANNVHPEHFPQNGAARQLFELTGISTETFGTLKEQMDFSKLTLDTLLSMCQAMGLAAEPAQLTAAITATNNEWECSKLGEIELAGFFSWCTKMKVQASTVALPIFKDVALAANPNALVYDRDDPAAVKARSAKALQFGGTTPAFKPPATPVQDMTGTDASAGASGSKDASATPKKRKAPPKSKGGKKPAAPPATTPPRKTRKRVPPPLYTDDAFISEDDAAASSSDDSDSS